MARQLHTPTVEPRFGWPVAASALARRPGGVDADHAAHLAELDAVHAAHLAELDAEVRRLRMTCELFVEVLESVVTAVEADPTSPRRASAMNRARQLVLCARNGAIDSG